MIRHIIAMALLCGITAVPSNECYGQTIRHTVTRGETIETIAELYGTTTDKLSSLNNDIDTFYTGLPIQIPYPEDFNTEEYTHSPERVLEYYADYKRLKRMYSDPYTKDAEDAYKKLIEKYSNVSNCSGAYYELAKYYYNKDKLNKARVTFNMALSDDALSPNKKKEGNAYIEKIENILAKREEKRKRIWGNIGTGIVQGLQAGAYAYMQYEQMKQSSGGSSGYNNFTGINSNLNSLDPTSEAYTAQALRNAETSYNNATNQITQNSNAFLSQSMASFQNEMQMAKQSAQQCHDLWVWNLGREPTTEEDQAWWTNYYQSMSATYTQSSSGATSTSTQNNNVDNTQRKSASGYYCTTCRDTKKCQTCNGSGWQDGLADIHDHYGAGINRIPCGNCSNGRSKGDGRCPFCK